MLLHDNYYVIIGGCKVKCFAESYEKLGLNMNKEVLKSIAEQMVAKGKGILAADESNPTCKKRFDSVGVECSTETRRNYRQILISTENIEDHLSGIILFDETIRQKTDDDKPFVSVLNEKNILPGIKVDTGAKDLALHPREKATEGLEGLRDRLAEYREIGASFAKWRSVITIGENLPSQACLRANAHGLARYAALCQEANFVPIVEPEVLINGDHNIEKCYEVTKKILKELYKELIIQDVYLEGTILKASMVIAGNKCPVQNTPEEIADMTVKCLKECVPTNVPGVMFLSGGQTEIQSTEHLNLMNSKYKDLPWKLSFSYGRAIQSPVLQAWANGDDDNAKDLLRKRIKMNGLATLGQWNKDME